MISICLIITSIVYIFAEGFNYVMYKIKKNNVQKSFNIIKKHNTSEMRLAKINSLKYRYFDDQLHHNSQLKISLEELFYRKLPLEKIPRDNLAESINYQLNNGNFSVDDIDIIDNFLSKVEKKLDIEIGSNYENVDYKYIKWGHENISAVYKPLPLTCAMYLMRKYSDLYYYHHGFRKINFDNVDIWDNCVDDDNPIILMHCSIGGNMFYKQFVRKLLENNRRVIIPEVRSISWRNTDSISIMDDICSDIKKYIDTNHVNYPTLICHSFGCNLGCNFINCFNPKIKKIIFIEGGIFLPRIMNIYTYFNMSWSELFSLPADDIITIPFFIKEMGCQYYFKRNMWLDRSLLNGFTDVEKNGNIHIVLAENDTKVITKPIVDYIISKKMPYTYKVFENERHASFIHNHAIQNHVVNLA